MNDVTYDISFTEKRNRLTVFFRYFMNIPHLLVLGVWGIAAQVAAVAQWFVILFTGKRNEGIARFHIGYLGYQARVMSFALLMFDNYPKFGTDPAGVPMAYSLPYEESANRLTSALRIIWAIPAIIIGEVVMIAALILTMLQWFIILFTGKANRGMWAFQRRALHMALRVTAYLYLATDTYPKFV